jgi:putative ABC transport system ATP-binding protein
MTDENREPLLHARGLSRAVDGRLLWTELSFAVAGGERVAITGPSGSGKTLLMRTLAGLEPLQAGEIRFRGASVGRWRMPEYRSRVLLLPQRPALPEGTVEAALAAPFGFRVHHDRHYQRAQALAYLEPVGRGRAFLDRPTDALSGGEAQLAALLRALLLEPQLLLLDEPTASLDAAAAEAVEALVGAWLERSAGRAYLWTSHDPAQIARVSDRRVELGAP